MEPGRLASAKICRDGNNRACGAEGEMMIYVIQQNGGTDGYSGAISATPDKEAALNLAATLSAQSGTSFVVFEVPVWPEWPMTPYHSVKPAGGE